MPAATAAQVQGIKNRAIRYAEDMATGGAQTLAIASALSRSAA